MSEQPTIRVWRVPMINCGEHEWVDITVIRELPNRHFMCALCSAEYMEPHPPCRVTTRNTV